MQTSRLPSVAQRAVFHQPTRPRLSDSRIENSISARPYTKDNFSSVGADASWRSLLSSSVTGQQDSSVQDLFKEQFTDKAQDPKEFHAFMKQVFGADYDMQKAEGFRQKALAGDFSWLPKVQYVSDAELGGAHGAYDSASGTVFLNESLKANPSLAAQTFVDQPPQH